MKKSRFKRLTQQSGYSLLALVIVIAIIAVMLASSLDTYHAETVRDKEDELIFRGEEVARAIARYNNGGKILPLRVGAPFPTKLEELVKQTNINGQKFVYLRKYALKDIFSGDGDWQPIRAGDPRIAEYLQNWSAYYLQPIPDQYQFLAGSKVNLSSGGSASTFGSANTNGNTNGNEDEDDDDDDDEDEDETPSNGTGLNPIPGGIPNSADQNNNNNNNSNGFGSFGNNGSAGGFSNLDENERPIIGVVSTNKGNAYRRLFGKDVTYDKWLFIYMPPVVGGIVTAPNQLPGGEQNNPNPKPTGPPKPVKPPIKR